MYTLTILNSGSIEETRITSNQGKKCYIKIQNYLKNAKEGDLLIGLHDAICQIFMTVCKAKILFLKMRSLKIPYSVHAYNKSPNAFLLTISVHWYSFPQQFLQPSVYFPRLKNASV